MCGLGSVDRFRLRSIVSHDENGSVVATQFDVAEHQPATHRVVRDAEDVVRFSALASPLQDSLARIGSLDESHLFAS